MKTASAALIASGIVIAVPAFGQPNKVPAPAAKAGYTELTFGPDVTMGKNWRMWTDLAAVSQNKNGTVTIKGGGNGYNAQIATATPNADGTYTGTAFGGGGYFEATLSFVGVPVTDGGWPSFWSNDIENQIQELTGNGASQWQGQPAGFVNSIEVDFVECMTGAGSYGFAMHNWYGFQSSIQKVSSLSSGSPGSLPARTDTSKPHKYGFLWVPATATTKGTGQWFFDGVQIGNTVSWDKYNPNTPPPPVDGTSAFSVLDSRNLYLILGTGPSNPMTVTSVTAWQKPGAGSSPLARTTNNITIEQAQINGALSFDKAMLSVQATTQQPPVVPEASPITLPADVATTTTTDVSSARRIMTPTAPSPVGTAVLAPQSQTLTMPADAQERIMTLETQMQQVQQEMMTQQQDIAALSSGAAPVAQTTAAMDSAAPSFVVTDPSPKLAAAKGKHKPDPEDD